METLTLCCTHTTEGYLKINKLYILTKSIHDNPHVGLGEKGQWRPKDV